MKRSSCKMCIGLISLAVILTIPLVFLLPEALAVEYTFNTIDVPGASVTTVYGINNSGHIVGQYNDSTGSHGFKYVGGTFTTIDVPGASYTAVTGINDLGHIVGVTTVGGPHGFLDVGGTFTLIDVPGASVTNPDGINNSGHIVGNYLDAKGWHGFLYIAGTFTPIDFPGVSYTYTTGINSFDHIVGGYIDAKGWHGFLYVAGTFTTIDVPGASLTQAYGINDFDHVVGVADATAGGGFLYVAGTLTPIAVPGGLGTQPFGINNSDNIVGDYGNGHGFLATPVSATINVAIDIKPGASPNSINPKSNGKIPVAILSTEAFDALTQIDLSSLTFGRTGDEQSLAFCHGSEDVNRDRLQDLVCHFLTQATGFQCGDTEGILKGKTKDGTAIEGSDSVKIVPCK